MESAAQLRLKLSSALLMNGYAAEALSQAEADLAVRGLDQDVYEAVLLTALGELGEAEGLLVEDVEDIRADDDRAWAVGVSVRRSRRHRAAGQIAEAVAHATSALALADEIGARLFVPLARTDGPIVAVGTMAGVFDNLPASKRVMLEEPGLAAWMVRCALAAGDRSRAQAVVDAADQLSLANTGFPPVAAIALHARGLLDHDAAALLQASSDHAHLWAHASAAEDAGAVLDADEQPTSGLDILESAIALYERAGAEHDAQRAQRRRRELRVRAPQAARRRRLSDWSGLTDTERRISALVSPGASPMHGSASACTSPATPSTSTCARSSASSASTRGPSWRGWPSNMRRPGVMIEPYRQRSRWL